MNDVFAGCIGAVLALCAVSVACLVADVRCPHEEDVHCRFGYVSGGALVLALIPLGVMVVLA